MMDRKCPIGLDPRTACRDCFFRKLDGCDYEEFRQRKEREDLIAMRQVK